MASRSNDVSGVTIHQINSLPKAKRGRPKQNKRGRPRLTVKQKLQLYLKTAGDFTKLGEIYNKLGAETTIEKAGIRGVLNRNVGRGGIFVRNRRSHGEYKAA